jgi:ElaA protein
MSQPAWVWQCKPFSALRAAELYRLLQLRSVVFVVEQNCPYLDIDDKDEHALHVMGWAGDQLVACSRILPGGVSYDEVSIGRVATAISHRRTGLGRELMRITLRYTHDVFGDEAVRIGAQAYLEQFYASFGFVRTSENYLEDDIPHLEMVREASRTETPSA